MTSTTLARRAPRRARPVDLDLFTGTVDAALVAFSQDVSYAVAMARAAVVIARKRDVWTTRRTQIEHEPSAVCAREAA